MYKLRATLYCTNVIQIRIKKVEFGTKVYKTVTEIVRQSPY